MSVGVPTRPGSNPPAFCFSSSCRVPRIHKAPFSSVLPHNIFPPGFFTPLPNPPIHLLPFLSRSLPPPSFQFPPSHPFSCHLPSSHPLSSHSLLIIPSILFNLPLPFFLPLLFLSSSLPPTTPETVVPDRASVRDSASRFWLTGKNFELAVPPDFHLQVLAGLWTGGWVGPGPQDSKYERVSYSPALEVVGFSRC
ncbi:uncharacterized protein BO95DRAFT_283519 [Aspergillus brunneoviolaceus CBS 621.78]|uniref:Uncharacterized protein n=1 Tax=Aspergillus brunneoviolaceus CBS 621.78 TaxID=1450534 RepID=A0ACD1GJQ6_9EURO|nr:hypothetical protein BO95DRAFT_283519 [Aspergillus brunneoviolaceus CBS 621.78]RAH49405.1 hypothetical protein BO95DRAFT_283519 [Aspergillus brunneoviolaceus CBS 621.78]